MSAAPQPIAWLSRDGQAVPLTYCRRCKSHHPAGEHSQPPPLSVVKG